MVSCRLCFVLFYVASECDGRRIGTLLAQLQASRSFSLAELRQSVGLKAGFSPTVSGVQSALPRSHAHTSILRQRRAPPVAALAPGLAAVAPAGLTDFAVSIVPRLRPTLMPVLGVIVFCLIGMLPAGVLALQPKYSKLFRRVFTGCVLGIVVSLWIFSGLYCFLFVFSLQAIVAQNEYFAMARNNGCFPTWKLGTLGSIGMYLAACSPNLVLRDALFPLTGTIIIVYLMVRRSCPGIERNTPPLTMHDVSTSFMGIYYFGYMPSFWVRLQALGPLSPSVILSQLLPPASPIWKWSITSSFAASSFSGFSVGTIIQWWTMFAVVCADVGAFFAGKRFGKTPLMELSPKKTVEGFLGGCAAAVCATTAGATLMGWPKPLLSGPLYGIMVAMMALIGDLTVSLLKRSAGFKDTGNLLPGHGGLLDRIDSYLLVPAPAYFFVRWLLPLGP